MRINGFRFVHILMFFLTLYPALSKVWQCLYLSARHLQNLFPPILWVEVYLAKQPCVSRRGCTWVRSLLPSSSLLPSVPI
jgi:hypothetical protein